MNLEKEIEKLIEEDQRTVAPVHKNIGRSQIVVSRGRIIVWSYFNVGGRRRFMAKEMSRNEAYKKIMREEYGE